MTEKEKTHKEQRDVELVPHNPEWSILFEKESKRILDGLTFPIVGIYHIGSTSVPGIKAKPILDFVLEVEKLEDVIQAVSEFKALGYQSRGEFGISGRQFFTRDTHGERTHHLHVFETGHPDIDRHTVFRDYLRANPGAAREYERLKERLAKRFPKQSGDYTAAKSDFILSMDEIARYWLEHKQTTHGQVDQED